MTDIKITLAEGTDQFHAEGDSEIVQKLLREWRTRTDMLREDARAYMDMMLTKHDELGLQGTGSRLTPPFGPRRIS